MVFNYVGVDDDDNDWTIIINYIQIPNAWKYTRAVEVPI